ncbi:hypothetical protein BJ165DRAFT_1522407 [Panaeolus papilionaceus]|nr:hypothetical protein BJ165DRAFT_1522407 [Panaeolus papilionaceus]
MGSASGTSTPHPVAQTVNNEFDDKVSYVRRYAGRVEKEIVSPAFEFGQSAFEKRPLSSLLLGIFLLLSAIPILLFIVAVLCTTLSLISIAIGAALLASFTISLGLFSILATTLIGTFFTSILLTLGTIGVFLSSKLVFLAWRDGQEGIYEWTGQTKQQCLYILGYQTPKPEYRPSPSPDYTPQMHNSGIALTEDTNGQQSDDGYTTDSGYKVEG